MYGTASARLATEEVAQEESEGEFEIFPNPVKTQLTIRSNTDYRGARLRILDTAGLNELGAETVVHRNDAITVEEASRTAAGSPPACRLAAYAK